MAPEIGGRSLDGVVLALDVDGVLLDPDRGGSGPWADAFGEQFGVDAALLNEAFFRSAWAEVIVGRVPIESALGAALEELGWTMGVDAALRCWFEADLVVETTVVAAAQGWADRGARLVLASNQEARRAQFLEGHLAGLLPVSGVAFSGTLGLRKDDPAFYARAERELGLEGRGGSIVFLDDTRRNIEVAIGCGWAGVHFDPRGDWWGEVEAAFARISGEGA
jgi:putative hydrolase of the HAD superfamily